MAIYQEAAGVENGQFVTYDPALQADMASFANMWMKNIKEQQDLKLPPSPKPQLPSASGDPSP